MIYDKYLVKESVKPWHLLFLGSFGESKHLMPEASLKDNINFLMTRVFVQLEEREIDKIVLHCMNNAEGE